MNKALALFLLLLLTAVFAACPGGDQGSGDDASGTASTTGDNSQDTPAATTDTAAADPVERGREIYYGTDYSNTGLTCAHCHAGSPAEEADRIFIAHSGHGAASRGAWKISKPEQLQANKGYASTLIDAANVCVKASYMDHGDELIEGDDAEALQAFLESIATEDEPFMIAKAKTMPVPGLTPDLENGENIFYQSCAHCHEADIEGLEELDGAAEWMNPLQVMAKVRKLGDNWWNAFDGKDYANMTAEEMAAALASGGNGHGEGEEEEHEHHGVFKEGAMPFYGTDILTDQQVVDVAYFVGTVMTEDYDDDEAHENGEGHEDGDGDEGEEHHDGGADDDEAEGH